MDIEEGDYNGKWKYIKHQEFKSENAHRMMRA